MQKQASVLGTKSMYNLTVSNREEIRPVCIVADSTSYFDLFCQEIDNRFEIDKVPALTLSVSEVAGVASWPFPQEPRTPTSSLPASSASSPISTHEPDLTWDSPCTPQTPLQRGCHTIRELTTPLTPPEYSESKIKTRFDVAELTSETPSRVRYHDDENNFKNHMRTETLGASVRRLKPLFKSIKHDDALSPDEHASESLLLSSKPKIAPWYKYDDKTESILAAIDRRSKTSTSGPKSTGCTDEVAESEPSVSTQSSTALCFDYSHIPTQDSTPFVPPVDIAFSESVPQSFAFAKDKSSQELKLQVKTPHIKTETTSETYQKVPHGCKGNWKLLEQIISFQINDRLIDDPNTCVATTGKQPKEMKRCSTRRQPHLNAVEITVDAVRSCVSSRDYSNIPKHIKRLIKNVMCPFHQTMSLRKTTANPRMEMLRKLIETLPRCQESMVLIFAQWLEAILKINKPELLRLVDSRSSSPLPLAKSITYHPDKSNDCTLALVLKATVQKPLTNQDLKSGFIYMFWDQKHFGMIKIGRTNDLARRLKEWNRDCKVTHHYHRTPQDGEPVNIPHVQRIEKLMHLELGNYHKKRICAGCGRTHIEWFDISAEKAKQVYQKWQDWIMQKPYAQDDSGNWVIRPEMLESLSEVCTPVVFAQPVKVVRPRPSLPTTRSKPRRSLASK